MCELTGQLAACKVCTLRSRQLERALRYARAHLAHADHGVDLCFACFLEVEIDELLGTAQDDGYECAGEATGTTGSSTQQEGR